MTMKRQLVSCNAYWTDTLAVVLFSVVTFMPKNIV